MPTQTPEFVSGKRRFAWYHCKWLTAAVRPLRPCLLSAIVAVHGGAAHAQDRFGLGSEILKNFSKSTESYEILLLAIFGGAMSFALLSAFWMIRERGRIIADNQNLKRSVADMRVSNDYNKAMLALGDQRNVIWNGPDEAPTVIGSLPAGSGTPESDETFLKFDEWLDADFASSLQKAMQKLREKAVSFDMVVQSKSGGVLEVVGATSGSYAIVKFRDLTGLQEDNARLQVEHGKLSRSFDHVEQLLSSIPVPVWLRDNQGKLTWVNEAYTQAIDSSDPRVVVEENLELFDSGQRATIQEEIRDGQLYDNLLPATIAGDRKKMQVLCVKTDTGGAGMALDKSDVDEVNRLLRETNESHSRMLDQMASAVAIFDNSQRLIFFNNSFQQLWKLDPGLLEGQPSNGDIFDAMRDGKLLPEHPDWRKWRESQLAIYRSLEPSEEWWHLLDGQTIRVVATPRNHGGCTWIFENVTERLALESNYNALMRVQGETLDHLNEAVAVFGSNGQLKLFNPALEALWQDADIIVQEGLHISRIIDGWETSVSNTEALQTILGVVTGFDDARNQIDGRMELSNGHTLEYAIVPLPDRQAMLTFLDITANVNFEKALRERAEALEASDLLKSKFIQHVSYELRAPLTSISGFGEILKTGEIGKLNTKQDEYLSHINEAAHVLREIVDDILDLASIDAGTMTLEYSKVDLETAIQKSIDTNAIEMKEKGLKASLTIAPDSAKVNADQLRLEQILSNVISNAVNFSPDGGLIRISAQPIDAMHEIRIMDEGSGIDPSMVEVIFDRFESRPSSNGKNGTGLGLSIVRSFIELHGGTVSIDTDYEQGTCFVCRLPVDPNPNAMDPEEDRGAPLKNAAVA